MRLTDHQIELLAMAANGDSIAEMAADRMVSTNAIKHSLEAARNRSRSRNRSQLLARTVYEGLIVLGTDGYFVPSRRTQPRS